MFIITCPYCGPRDQSEFAYAGEAHRTRPADPAALSDTDWADYLFARSNEKGVHAERWVHAAGCRRCFNALRNTATDRFLAFYAIGTPKPEVTEATPETPCGEQIGSGNDAIKVERPAADGTGDSSVDGAGDRP